MPRQQAPLYKSFLVVLGFLAALSAVITALNFPYDTDPAADVSSEAGLTRYYKDAYKAPPPAPQPATASTPAPGDSPYVEIARRAAIASRVPEQVRSFVETYRLKDKRVLEVGAGSGLLQDMVDDYTGLDISPTARRFFHKPFVEASATAIPFPSDTFDAVWSIWTLEHIPNPETALVEMRRVVRHDGYILIWPTWDCTPWAAEGYEVRPFSDFDWKGKLIKFSVPFRRSGLYRSFYVSQIRAIRAAYTRLRRQPSRLRFTRLTPNYDKYWVPDSDAVISLDFHEAYLWFTTRGDACLNCPSQGRLLTPRAAPPLVMIIQVRKRR